MVKPVDPEIDRLPEALRGAPPGEVGILSRLLVGI